MKDREYRIALQNFLGKLQERENKYVQEVDLKQFPHNTPNPASFSVMSGRKYDRIVRHTYGQRSAYAFIHKETGAILKASSWNQPDPAKYQRGNIYAENCLAGTERYGVVYLR